MSQPIGVMQPGCGGGQKKDQALFCYKFQLTRMEKLTGGFLWFWMRNSTVRDQLFLGTSFTGPRTCAKVELFARITAT
jgi:hypothetical protein